jgi:DNA-binding transcriptional regulator YiaG
MEQTTVAKRGADKPIVSTVDGYPDAAASALTAIGLRIKEIRLTRGMTLQSVSDVSGLSPSMLSLVERGRASPSIGSLVVIASAAAASHLELQQHARADFVAHLARD